MDNKKEEYKEMWEDFALGKASSYLGYKFKPTHRVGLTNFLREEKIYKLLSPGNEDVVLDAGCASGRQLFKIFDKIKIGWGTDISHNFIEQANRHKQERRISNLFFAISTVESFPFESSFFDKIICAEVLEHVADKQIALAELLRVLKPGGSIIITVPNFNSDGTLWGRFLRFLGIRKFIPLDTFNLEAVNKHKDAHVREFSKKKLLNWLKENNLDINYIGSVSFLDCPGINTLMKYMLHFSWSRKAIIFVENILSSLGLVYGRHLIVKAIKNK